MPAGIALETNLISGLSDTLISNGGLPTLGSMLRWNPATGKWEDSTTVVLSKLSGGNLILQSTTHATKGYVGVVDDPRVTATYPLFALGSGPFDGSTSGFFTGSASGTHLGVNAASGFAGNLIALQVAGANRFRVTSAGVGTLGGALAIGGTLTSATATGLSSSDTITYTSGSLSLVAAGSIFATVGSGSVFDINPNNGGFDFRVRGQGVNNLLQVNGATAAQSIGFNSSSTSNFITIAGIARTTGSPATLSVSGGAHTTLTASTEAPDINIALARTVQWATGTLALQRAFRIQAPTYAFVGASTLTEAVTLDIGGPPTAGTNATFTGASALRIKAAPFASSKMGLVSLGDGAWDGATAGFYTGNSAGNVIAVNTASGFLGRLIDLQIAGTPILRIGASTMLISPSPASGGATGLTFTAAANTATTASTESPGVNFNLSATVQWATGTLALQRAMRIQAPTYGFVGASTLTEAVTLDIGGPPTAGTNATFTGASALRIKAAPFASSKMGLISLGNGEWDGATAGFFAGADANGTALAVNITGSAYFANFQKSGVTKFNVDNSGNASSAGGWFGAQGSFYYDGSSQSLRSSSATSLTLYKGSTKFLELGASTVTISDAIDLVFNTTTGTKLGTATSQKLSLWNKTPIVQPTTGITAAAFVTNTSLIANDTATFGGYTIGQMAAAMINFGLLA